MSECGYAHNRSGVEGLSGYGHAGYTIYCNCCWVYDTYKRCVDGSQDVSGAEVETTCIDSKESRLNKGIQ